MTPTTIDAVYLDGVFRPTTPPDLPEGTTVRVTVIPDPKSPTPGRAAYEMIRAIAAMPDEPSDPNVTSLDVDRILYGGPRRCPMIFVDSGAWYAQLVPADPHHRAAATWAVANDEPLITTDYVIDETLTLLRARGERSKAVAFGTRLFAPDCPVVVHYLSRADLAAAWAVFARFADKDWSFTDCTSKVVLEHLGITTAFTFDHHFRQFGTVAVVP